MTWRVAGTLAFLTLFLGGVAAFYAVEAEIAVIAPPDKNSFTTEEISRGKNLAAIGNCATCHTSDAGAAFSGGRAFKTAFGTIHSTNITPEPETGVGKWSLQAFSRAMRRGVDRSGQHLYPAFPYDHFTKLTDDDVRALYAFVMTRTQVKTNASINQMRFPFSYRPLIAGWKLLYFRDKQYKPDPTIGAELNRGLYLVDGLGHCGACHTARNALGAERPTAYLSGGESDGWVAYAINKQSPAPSKWTEASLAHYLKTGWASEHGISRGPMAAVTANLASVADADVAAIAKYIARLMDARELPARTTTSTTDTDRSFTASTDSLAYQTIADNRSPGSELFAGACGGCHSSSRAQPYGGLNLRLSSAINAPDPTNIINVVNFGLMPPQGRPGPIMPPFSGAISNEQLVELLNYMRATFSDKTPWLDLPALVARQRARLPQIENTPTHDGQADASRSQVRLP